MNYDIIIDRNMDVLFYTLDDIYSFSNKDYKYLLNRDVITTIDILFNEIVTYSNVSMNDDRQNRRLLEKTSDQNNRYKTQKKSTKHGGSINNESIETKWDKQPVFKATKIEIKEGIEKNINEIRILLNKISDKTYDIHKEAIIQKINDISSHENNEDLKRIALVLFDTSMINS